MHAAAMRNRHLPETPGTHLSWRQNPSTSLYRCTSHFQRCRSDFHCTGQNTNKQSLMFNPSLERWCTLQGITTNLLNSKFELSLQLREAQSQDSAVVLLLKVITDPHHCCVTDRDSSKICPCYEEVCCLCLQAKHAAFEVSVTSHIYSCWKVSEVWKKNLIRQDSISVLCLRTG